MNRPSEELLNLNGEDLAILSELLEAERSKLMLEIRHTGQGAFRDGLRHRLTLVQALAERCGPPLGTSSAAVSEASIR